MRIVIIGGGLAGCACAYAFKTRGAEPVIYEASGALASGASGNDVGLYNPRFTAQLDAQGAFYSAAFFKALEVFENFGAEIDWTSCGALHLVTDEKKVRRFPQTVQNWGWAREDMRMLGAQEASDVAGVEISCNALYLPRSGTVSPRKLCAHYAQGVEVHHNRTIEDLGTLDADAVILAGGMGVAAFPQTAHLPLKPVRGQVSYIRQTPPSALLRCTLGYGGYLAPARGGVHCLGSTFQPWLAHAEILPQDDADNIAKLAAAVPFLAADYTVAHHRAGVRTTTKDHFPLVGQVDEHLYVSTAHGSHGILSSLMAANVLADMIFGLSPSVSAEIMTALRPERLKS